MVSQNIAQKEPCTKIDECPILRSFRDRDVPEAIYERMICQMCDKCKERGKDETKA